MKNASQSGVFSLKAPRMRGLFASPEVRSSRAPGLLAAVAAEELLQQVDHRPEVAAFLDVDLEQVSQVVERRRGQAEVALLLDRRRLGVALGDDDAAQVGAVLAGHVLPGLLALVVAEVDLALGIGRVEEDAPAVVAHLHVVEVGPALRVDAGGGAQVDVVVGRALRADVVPPVDEVRLPLLERALQRAVVGEVDVVRDLLRVVDGHGVCLESVRRRVQTRLKSKPAFSPVP